MIHVRVIRGANQDDEIKTHRGIVSVGRAPQCTLALDDKSVSHLHGELLLVGSRCVYRDLLSRNGSFVRSGEDTFWLGPLTSEWDVEPGDEIIVGDTTIRVETIVGDNAQMLQQGEGYPQETRAVDTGPAELSGVQAGATAEIARFHEFLSIHSYDATSVEDAKNVLCDCFMEVFPNSACVAFIDLLPGCGEELVVEFVNTSNVVCRAPAAVAGTGVAKFSFHILAEAYRKRRLVFYGSDKALPDARSVQTGQMDSCMCAPLWKRKELKGFLHMHTQHGLGRPFTRRDAQLLCLLVNVTTLFLNRAADAKQRSTMRTAAAAGLAVSGLAHDAESILRTLGLNMAGVEKAHPQLAGDDCWGDVKTDLELLRFVTRDAIERLDTAASELHPRLTRLCPTVNEILRRCKDYYVDQADRFM